MTEDIEEIKKKLDAKDSPDKDETLKSLAANLKPVIRFFGGNTPENISGIFGSKEAIEEYKKSLGDEMITSLRLYTEANEKDMHKYGVPTTKELLNKILEMLTAHMENDRQASEQARQKQGVIQGLWQAIRPGKAFNAIRQLWNKIPDGWHKNPYVRSIRKTDGNSWSRFHIDRILETGQSHQGDIRQKEQIKLDRT